MPTNYAGNPLNYPTLLQLPSDGDPRSASSVNAALEGLADRTAALAKLHLAEVETYGQDDATSSHAAASAALTLTSTFQNVVAIGSVGTLQINDVVEVAFSCYVQTSAAAPVYLRIGNSDTPAFGLDSAIVESLNGFTTMTRITIHAWLLVTSVLATDLVLQLQAHGDVGTVTMHKGWTTIAKVYRRAS